MSNDISTLYTKEKNKKCGRYGYCQATHEKEQNIRPNEYGMFLAGRKRTKKNNNYKKVSICLIKRKVKTYVFRSKKRISIQKRKRNFND